MQLKDLNIMITGGGGFIGSHLAERLAQENSVLIVDDFSIGKRENLAGIADLSNVRIVEADVRNADQIHDLVQGTDVVFHLAISCLRTSLGHPFLSHDINAGGTLNLCVAAHQHAVKRFIYCSSSEVYGTAREKLMSESHPCEPTTVYGASKLAGELYALAHWRTYGLPVTVVRPFNTYGPREPHEGSRAEVIPRFMLLLQAGHQPRIYGDGRQTRDFTFVEETAEGLVKAAECDALVGDTVNIAYGKEVSIASIADLLMELTGTSHVGVQYSEERPGDVRRHAADISKARRLLGFKPEIDIKTGLVRYVEWFLEQPDSYRSGHEQAGRPNWSGRQ